MLFSVQILDLPPRAAQMIAVGIHMKKHSRSTLRVWRLLLKYRVVSEGAVASWIYFSDNWCSHGWDSARASGALNVLRLREERLV
jgi:hypothetical protein